MSQVIEELISDWNSNMTYKIKESDLLQPTETFVIKALSTLLGAMSIKDCYTLKMFTENKVEAQIAKAKFVQYIDDLYKVSDAKNSFLYFDLIQPISKKTIHLLKVLYNYLCYYQMMKKNVLGKVVETLEERDQLLKGNKDLKIEIERSKMQKEMLDSKIEAYMKELPVLKNRLEAISVHIKQQQQEVDKRKRGIETTVNSNRDALKKIETLNSDIVDEEEVNNLILDKQKLEQELEEIKERETATHTRLLEYYRKKEEHKKIVTEVEKLLNFLNLDAVLKQKTDVESAEKELQELKEKVTKIQEDFVSLKKEYETQVAATKKSIAAKKKKIKTQEKKYTAVHKENVKQKNILMELQNELEKETTVLEKSKQEFEQIMILGEQTLEYLSKGYVTFNFSECA